MTPREPVTREHAQALNEAHAIYGPHETADPQWRQIREAWITARERALAPATDTTPGGTR